MGRGAPMLTHLLFDDDSLLLLQASTEGVAMLQCMLL